MVLAPAASCAIQMPSSEKQQHGTARHAKTKKKEADQWVLNPTTASESRSTARGGGARMGQ